VANSWLALEAGADPAERIRAVRRAHETFVAAGAARGTVAAPVRDVVAASWRRSATAHVDPETTAPLVLDDAELDAYRSGHPLALVVPLFRELLGTFAEDGRHLVAICDAGGRLLWVEGPRTVRRRADRMNFVAGARWDESHAGTNAPGTALAVDHPVQIFATEHFSRPVQAWTCAAAPIHDPRTGRPLGAVDITGGDNLANPHSLALIQATARAAEAHLAAVLGAGNPGQLADPTARLAALGHDEALWSAGGRQLRLGRRHSEIAVLLAAHPDGLTGDQLGLQLYGDRPVSPVTLRAELARLRHLLGAVTLESRPYRLRVPVDTDFQAVTRWVEHGSVTAALAGYRGPLLPGSDAPGVVRLRHRVESELRAGLLAAGDAGLLAAWTRAPWGFDDLPAWQALAATLPAGSPRGRLAGERVRELDAEYGLPAGVRATFRQRRSG
jgi:hypothetical protein